MPRKVIDASWGDHLHEATRAILQETTTAKGQGLTGKGEGTQSQLADLRAAADSMYDLSKLQQHF